MKFHLTKFGLILIVVGTLGLLAAVIISFTVLSGLDQGALPAASFLSIMIGIAFAFPSMLQDTTGGVSTMRIIVFAVVMLFCTIYMKLGWSVTSFQEFTIDQRWVYILGLAFGSKAFQRYTEQAEEEEEKVTVKDEQTIKKQVSVTTGEKHSGKDVSKDEK